MFRTAKAVFALSEVERRDEAVADCKQLVWRFFEPRAGLLSWPNPEELAFKLIAKT